MYSGQNVYVIQEGLGDAVAFTALCEHYFKTFNRKMLVAHKAKEIFENNPYCEVIDGIDQEHLSEEQQRMLKSLGITPVFITYTFFEKTEYDEKTEFPYYHHASHLIETMAERIGFAGTIKCSPQIFLTEQEKINGKLGSRKQIVMLSLGKTQWKTCSIDSLRYVADRFKDECEIIQVGSEDDTLIADYVIDKRGRTTIRETAAICYNSELYVGPVSFVAHCAHAVKTRCVLAVPGTEPVSLASYASDVAVQAEPQCPLTDKCRVGTTGEICLRNYECIRAITGEQLYNAALRLLQQAEEKFPEDIWNLKSDANAVQDISFLNKTNSFSKKYFPQNVISYTDGEQKTQIFFKNNSYSADLTKSQARQLDFIAACTYNTVIFFDEFKVVLSSGKVINLLQDDNLKPCNAVRFEALNKEAHCYIATDWFPAFSTKIFNETVTHFSVSYRRCDDSLSLLFSTESRIKDYENYIKNLHDELNSLSLYKRRFYYLTHPHMAIKRLVGKLLRKIFFVCGKQVSVYLPDNGYSWKNKVKKLVLWLPKHILGKQYTEIKYRILKKNFSGKSSFINVFPKMRDMKERPLVSVIVPNFNHAAFLRERLDSIYGQTYKNIEVILLDDCSTDDSCSVLSEYAELHKDNTVTLFNEKNSGSPFAQWQKGIQKATGKFIWIAESDDWCELDFLEKLMPYFSDESLMLAFSRSVFMKNGEKVWSQEEYLHKYDMEVWESDFVVHAHHIVNKCFGYINIIPNVSSAVFRNPGECFELWNDAVWKKMKICGDWIFYLHLIRGGKLGYCASATNFYRQHEKNTSVSAQQNDIYYNEHIIVMSHVLQNYRIGDEYEDTMIKKLRCFYNRVTQNNSEKEFEKFIHGKDFKKMRSARKANIFMFLFAFSSGGGEVFPIHLANELKRIGYGVTIVNCGLQPTLPLMRNMVRADIPVVNLNGNFLLLSGIGIEENFGVEIVHSHHATVDYAITELKNLYPAVAHVVTMHGMYETMSKHDIAHNLPAQMNETAAWVYIADKNLKPVNAFLKENTLLEKLPNGLEIQKITPVKRESLGIPEKAFVMCLVSRALPEKGWSEAIKAMQLAQKQTSTPIHLLLLGNGPMFDVLKKQNIENVHLLGFCSNVRDYFAMADIGLLPSYFSGESFPLVIIECLLSKRPVIASDIGEVKNIIESNDGKQKAGISFALEQGKVPVGKFAELILKCINDKDMYTELCDGAAVLGKLFSIENVARQYEEVYTKIAPCCKKTAGR